MKSHEIADMVILLWLTKKMFPESIRNMESKRKEGVAKDAENP